MKKCVVCNVELKKKEKERPSAFKKRMLCSIQCRQKYLVKRQKARFVAPICKQCGKEIHTKSNTGKRSAKRKFCDDKCFRLWNRGANCKHWKGGYKKHGEYTQKLVGKNHPFSDLHGYIMCHRHVFEEYAKKEGLTEYLVEVDGIICLSPEIKIHHINHQKSDNRVSNLKPFRTQKEHFHYNYCPHCPHCNKSGELLGNPQ